jgi:hypothetical protein
MEILPFSPPHQTRHSRHEPQVVLIPIENPAPAKQKKIRVIDVNIYVII